MALGEGFGLPHRAIRLVMEDLGKCREAAETAVSEAGIGSVQLRNTQLTSALAILEASGMVEQAWIEFPERRRRYDSDRDVVLFAAQTLDGDINCAISGEALEDRYSAGSDSQRARLSAFRAHRVQIEEEARRKYISGQLEPAAIRLREQPWPSTTRRINCCFPINCW